MINDNLGKKIRMHGAPLLLTRFNFNPSEVWDVITNPFPDFNGVTAEVWEYTVEVWEWISNFIPHFIGYVITYQCWE